MMIHLKRAGKFDKLHGLILGGFTDSKDTDLPYGKTVDEILYEHVKDFEFPVCFHFPVSHEAENYALKIGGNYSLSVSNEKVSLEEILPQ
jgi:muramoyltetrapeptide carboxypeptidase